MSDRSKIVLILATCYVAFVGFEVLHSDGIVGMTRKNSGAGCLCHGVMAPTDSVQVWISGSDSVQAGTTNTYYILMKGGPAVAGGYNVAADKGILAPGDTTSYLMDGELTHVSPKHFQNDTVRWKFQYQAPVNTGVDTIFSVANSVNLNGDPTGDQYNFGPDFIVRIVPSSDVSEKDLPTSVYLYQNYPNPFNPATTISYRLENSSFVTLNVYSLDGKLVKALVKETQPPGMHEVQFDASKVSSGVYIYSFQGFAKNSDAGGDKKVFSSFKKMVVIK